MSDRPAGPGSAAPAPLLSAAGLTKRYGAAGAALAGAALEVRAGESLALLGPNGAGKTTLLTMLAGVARPTEGTVTAANGRVGWVPHDPAVYGRLTVRENLRLFAALEGHAHPDAVADRLIARADLAEYAGRRASRLSTGTRQRLNLAVALAGDPAVLLLDEPTATLSLDQRRRLWRWLEELRTVDGLAIVFATQSVREAEDHAGRLVAVAGGRIVFDGDAAGLVRRHGAPGDAQPLEDAFLRLVTDTP